MIFFNEHRLPLIGRTVISKKLYRKNLQKSLIDSLSCLSKFHFTIDIIRSLFEKSIASESITTKRRQCRFPTINCKAGIDQNEEQSLTFSLSLSLFPLHRSRIQRVHRARGGSFVFHFPSDTRADCSIELH